LFSPFFGPYKVQDTPALENKSNQGNDIVRSQYRYPLSDIWETDDAVMAEIELPGVKKDDINVDVDDGNLEISVEKTYEDKKEDKKKGSYRFERQYQGFYRCFTLPENVDEDNVEARYEDGVLKVKVPKKEVEQKERKKIEVQ
jgi:HSP20 family protein